MSINIKKILYLTAESSPYIKIGGLGDVSGSLPPILLKLYPDLFDIRMVMPYHFGLQNKQMSLTKQTNFIATFENFQETITIWQDVAASFPIYFLESPTLSDTPPYSDDPTIDLKKYCLFSKIIPQFTEAIQWQPDLYHANDWHTALAVYQTGTQAFKNNRSKPVKTILSIHNLPYMGKANRDILRQFGIQPSTNQSLPEWARELPLPMGIARADHVLTVSNGYAQEMMTPAFGCGLDSFLRKNHTKISGILNGIDPTIWNPQTDTFVHQNFSQTTLSSRLENKKKLFSQYFPGSSTALPLLIWIGRLQHQKGADIFLESLNNILNQQWRCIILGTGDIALEKAVNKFAVSNPEKIVAITEFSNTLSHQLYAGGDMIIIPSRYEPCGLSQMFAMRYGCLPIATATGGLKDTIADIRTSDNPDGFLFNDPVEKACSDTIEMAMDVYRQHPEVWQRMQTNAMKKDFSWTRSAKQYKNLYLKLLETSS